jgi:hypothetical protein
LEREVRTILKPDPLGSQTHLDIVTLVRLRELTWAWGSTNKMMTLEIDGWSFWLKEEAEPWVDDPREIATHTFFTGKDPRRRFVLLGQYGGRVAEERSR